MTPEGAVLALALAVLPAEAVDIEYVACRAARAQSLIEHRWREFEYLKDDRKEVLDGGRPLSNRLETRRVHRTRPDGLAANELVAVDGRPLAPAEALRQQGRWQARVAELSAGPERERELARFARDRDEKASAMAAMDRAFRIRLEGLDWLGGEPAYVFSFAPRPEFRPATEAQATFQKMQGVAWVRVRDLTFARLEADFIENASVKFGPFAVIRKGSHMLFENGDVEPGVPMVKRLELDLGLRILFLMSRHERRVTTYREHRRANAPPRQFVP